jgi:hypothetical protein
MKKLYILLLLIATGFSTFAQEPATFTVEVPAGTESVRMTGNFWGWNPVGGPVAISNGLDNTWSVTLFTGGGESQSDFEYLWVITDADGTSNPVQENLIASAVGGDCVNRINAGEFNTDFANYANRKFIAAGSDDIRSDVYGSCYLAGDALELKGIASIAITSGSTTTGKFVHLYANDNIADLSIYSIRLESNSNNNMLTTTSERFLPAVSASAGDHILLCRTGGIAELTVYFVNLDLFDLVEEGSQPTGNGDDRVGLFKSSSLIEVYGILGVDGDGTAWEPEFFNYLDAWAYKEMGVWTAGGSGCTNTSDITTFDSNCPYPFADSSLSNTEFSKSELSIFPNPTNGFVNIKTPFSGVKNIQLYDIMGRQVLSTKLNSDVLDVSSVHSGLYLLRISIDDRSSTTKLIIE